MGLTSGMATTAGGDPFGANARFYIKGSGDIGIGTISPTEKLSVNGNIKAKKVIVATNWSDYVFDEDYQLMPLQNVAKFIKTNKHLPDVPSAKEVEEKGISLGDTQALLLKKIEELTLYIIELKSLTDAQQHQIEKLTNELQAQKNQQNNRRVRL